MNNRSDSNAGRHAVHSYRPLRKLSKWLLVSFLVGNLLDVASVPFVFEAYRQAKLGRDYAADVSTAYLVAESALGLATLVVWVVTIVLFLLWMYRITANLRSFGLTDSYHPVWAVVSWFIPVVALGAPKLVVNQAWRGSNPKLAAPYTAKAVRSEDIPDHFAFWWFFWVVSGLLGAASLRANVAHAMGSLSRDERVIFAGVDVALTGLWLVAAVLAMLVVRDVTRRQEACHAARVADVEAAR